MEQSGSGLTSAISLPKGGGAIKGVGETFQPNLFTGTGNFSIPIPTSPGRQGFGPKLTLQYSTGNGSSPFGLGWQISIPRVTRKTEKGLPTYTEKDVFILSGAEDLVFIPVPVQDPPPGFTVTRYRPRTEGLFARIEQWVSQDGDVHWRATTSDNVTSIYGRTKLARVFDQKDHSHIFEWLLEETFDAKGNHILYEYAAEPTDLKLISPFEENRSYGSQRHIRRILYGNVPDAAPAAAGRPSRTGTDHKNLTLKLQRYYLFEVVFDYSRAPLPPEQTYPALPADGEQEVTDQSWEPRPDPFSSYRSGFEVRTLRRCHRILMFHHFAAEKGVAKPQTLVKATELAYQEAPLSLLAAVTVRGYRKDETNQWRIAEMPPLEFKYSSFEPGKQRYQSIAARGDDLPPFSLLHPDYAMVDLQGDGLPDILETSSNGFRHWRNLGGGLFDRPHPPHAQPVSVRLSQAGVAFGDMAGDGLADLIVEAPLPGFYETTPEGEWRTFRKFDSGHYPSFSLSEPNVRLLDLTGDGRPDALMTTDHCFLWLESLGEEGYAAPQSVTRLHDPDKFPDVYFNDPSGRVRLADMSGGGLMDIVLLHNGRVEYWPNLGYGHFGPRITMANAPRLEDGFDPKRLFLVDMDGSGCADLVYVGHDRVRFWFNLSGNCWSEEHVIEGTPFTTNLTALQFADVFGTGTATLVWSYDYGTVAGGNYKALDFCGGVKPYVLTEMDNNLGATTRVAYAPSTKFYLEDLASGEPWVTALPFPVHVVEKVEVINHIGKTKLVTTYKYHHGYYDGHEREFRGFGRVDQFDTEVFEDFSGSGLHGPEAPFANGDAAYYVPPVETRTWFHTGIWFDPDRHSDHRELTAKFRGEYYAGDPQAFVLEEHIVECTGGATREAWRALRGALLHTEVYGRDDSVRADHPYLVTENRYRIRELQAPSDGSHGVYLTTREEGLSYHYERNPADPRIAHEVTLATDAFGNVTDSVAIAYPRRTPAFPEQAQSRIVYTKANFINEEHQPDWYYVGVPCQTRRYEVGGTVWQGQLLGLQDFTAIRIESDAPHAADNRLDFHEEQAIEAAASPCKRLIECSRTYFRSDAEAASLDAGRLDLGKIDRLSLPWETYRAAFSRALIDRIYVTDLITDEMLGATGYVQEPDAAGYWWAPSGRQSFDSDAFCLPVRSRDPFGNDSSVDYDPYRLLPVESVDPLQNRLAARNDYRILQPELVTDPNGNRTRVAFDALGLVTGTAVMGKRGEGDTIDGFEADPELREVEAFFADPKGKASALLRKATTSIVYDLHRFRRTREANPQDPTLWEPVFAAMLARETHASDPLPPDGLKIQLGFGYSDGFGREIQKKIQAEPGPLVEDGPDVSTRWVGSGWTIFNNKGKPVRQYETFFSATHSFEFGVQKGVSPILFYDPLERVVATLHPNHTYEKVVFDPWRQETWDVNDTLCAEFGDTAADFTSGARPWFDPADDADVGAFFGRLEAEEYLPTWFRQRTDPTLALERWPDEGWREAERIAARNALAHAATPTVAHLDVLGRPFLTVADNGQDQQGQRETIETRVRLDIQGNDRVITDPMGINAFIHEVDMLGRKIEIDSVDAGRKQVLLAVDEKPAWSRDANGNHVRIEYDALRRPTQTWVTSAGTTHGEILAQAIIYGEAMEALFGQDACLPGNHRGRVYATLDGAGLALNHAYDFKGNLLATSRRVAKDYGQVTQASGLPEGTAPDWSTVPLGGLVSDIENELNSLLEEAECFLSTSRFDALNRVIHSTAPDHTQTPGIPLLPDPAWITKLAAWLSGVSPTAPFAADGSSYRYSFNDAGLLETVELEIKDERHGQPPDQSFRTFVENIDYNEKGQRIQITYGNGVSTGYEYCPKTFHLLHIVSRRKRPSGNSEVIQDLRYTYDPAGNIAQIEDAAFPVVFHANQRVCPTSRYKYDPAYRLVRAFGREHTNTRSNSQAGAGKSEDIFINLSQPVSNGHALRNYIETYRYDKSGNLEKIRHIAHKGSWTRTQDYATDAQASPSNRLLTSGTGTQTGSAIEHRHDANGNMTLLPHLPQLDWDHANQLKRVKLNDRGSQWAWYTYDTTGQRVRKVIKKNNAPDSERIYVGGSEVWREIANPGAGRVTLHVMDGQQRIALIETGTAGNSTPRIRYQITNQLGSAVMELDEAANRISYEEFYPYGCTAYLAGENWSEVEKKRYRYSGKERDEETGLYYYGARYYAARLGRWISCDPVGTADGLNLFRGLRNNPVHFRDRVGTQTDGGILPGGIPPEPPPVEVNLVPSHHGGYVPTSPIQVGEEIRLESVSRPPKAPLIDKDFEAIKGFQPGSTGNQSMTDEEKVMLVVNWAINKGITEQEKRRDDAEKTKKPDLKAEAKKGLLTDTEIIEKARRIVIAELRENKNIQDSSRNTVFRDAEYYLAARHTAKEMGIEGWVGASLGVMANGVYSIGKTIVRDRARSAKDFPNAPSGGNLWIVAGAMDARNDTNEISSPSLLTIPPSKR